MREIGRPEILRAKPDDSGASEQETPLGIGGPPSKVEHRYVYEINSSIEKYLGAGGGKQPADVFQTFMQYAGRYVDDDAFPRNLRAIYGVELGLIKLLRPITEREKEIMNDLRNKNKREWDDRRTLSQEEGALITDEQREQIAKVFDRIRTRGWESYAREASAQGIQGATKVPTKIETLFLAYILAVKNFYPGPLDERLQRLDECALRILESGPPQDKRLLRSLPQQWGDTFKRWNESAQKERREV